MTTKRLSPTFAVALLLAALGPPAALHAGWPQPSISNDVVSMAFVDLDLDGVKEVLVATYGDFSTGSEVKAYTHDGTLIWSFAQPEFISKSALAVGDVDGDPYPEIAFGTRRPGFGVNTCSLYVLEADGSVKPGWPITRVAPFFSTPTLADLDGDGALDLVTIYSGSSVEAYRGDGQPLWTRSGNALYEAAVADLDGDSWPEVITGSSSWSAQILTTRHDGSDFGTTISFSGEQARHPIVADLDGDGWPEILVATSVLSPDGGNLYAFDFQGNLLPGWPQHVPQRFYDVLPAVGDVDEDGDLEIFIGNKTDRIHGWHHDGTDLPGWPVMDPANPVHWSIEPLIGDLDGDGQVEILVYSDVCLLRAFEVDGTPVAGYPIQLGDPQNHCVILEMLLGNLGATQDLALGVAVGGNGSGNDLAYVLLTGVEHDPGLLEWPGHQRDAWRTNAYRPPNHPPEIISRPKTWWDGQYYRYDLVALDQDGDPLRADVSYTSFQPVTVQVTEISYGVWRIELWGPGTGPVFGPVSFHAVVRDDEGANDVQEWTVRRLKPEPYD